MVVMKMLDQFLLYWQSLSILKQNCGSVEIHTSSLSSRGFGPFQSFKVKVPEIHFHAAPCWLDIVSTND